VKILKSLFTVILGFCMGLVLAEIIVRIFMPKLPDASWGTQLFCRDTVYDCRIMRPHVKGVISSEEFLSIDVASNAHGYRDGEWSSKKNRKHRVMVLGDSFAWGWGIPADSMLTRILEASDPDLAVFNLAIPGDDLYRMYSRLKYHIREVDPTHILVLNYTNDFYCIEQQRKSYERMKSRGLYDRDETFAMTCNQYYKMGWKDYMSRSYLYRVASRFHFNFRSLAKPHSIKKELDELKRNAYRTELETQQDTGWFKPPADFYTELLKDMAATRKVTILYIPPVYHTDSVQSAEIKRLLPEIDVDPLIVNRGLRKLASEFPNVSYLDPYEILHAQSRKRPLYFSFDGHLNSTGQRLLGNYLIGNLDYKGGGNPRSN
jgi:hypothetical protein